MAKRKKKKGSPPPKKKHNKDKSKKNELKQLMQTHEELDYNEALEILNAGLSYEEWQEKKEAERKKRRLENQTRMINLICSRHQQINEEEAKFIIENNLNPEDYAAE